MDFSKVKNLAIPEGNVTSISIGGKVVWKKPEEPPVTDKMFRFKNVSGQPNTLKLEKMHESAPTLSLEKSSNGVDFTSVDLYKGITLQKDETVYLRGNNASTTTVSDAGTAANKFTSTGLIEAHGNLNDITSGSLELKPYHFAFLFNGMENLTTAPDLPSVNLSECAYQMCFSACSNLVEGPKIYAQNLGKWSCNAMFMGCSKLKTIEMVIDHWDKPGDDFGAMIAWLNYAGPDGNLIAPNLTFADIPEGDNGLPKNWTLNGETRPVIINSFYIEDASGQPNTLSLTQTGAAPVKLEYSNDGIVWQEWVDCQTTTLPVAANSKVYLRGTNNVFSKAYDIYNKFNCTGKFNVGGDITSLLTPEGNVLDLTGRDNVFYYLFQNTNVIDASKLVLPATTLAVKCYSYMFQSCTSLTQAPKLPATTLASSCYSSMFYDCTSLTQAPELPAITLAKKCYYSMFWNCTSLTSAPELPAKYLYDYCYSYMFYGCRKLITASRILPANTTSSYCYQDMFDGCTSLVTAPELPATTLAPYCYSNMFYGCTSLTTAPKELPATTLAQRCYEYMFNSCTSLETSPDILSNSINGMYSLEGMFNGCSKLNYVKVGATTWNTSNTGSWLSGVSATGTFVKPTATNIPTGVNGIPSGWAVENV